jgi:hypothetical protein
VKLKHIVAIVGLLLLVAAILVSLLDVEAPALGRLVLDNVGEAVGIELEARAFAWSLGKGLVAEDVEASSRFPGGRLMINVDQVAFEHELVPLLARKVVIRRFTMKRPRGQIMRTQSSSSRATSESGESGGKPPEDSRPKVPTAVDLHLWISEFAIEDGTFTTQEHRSEREGITFGGLNVVFGDLRFQTGAITLLHGLVAQAELEARSIDVGTTRLHDVRGRMGFDKGRITLPLVEYSTSSGAYQARVTADFNQIPFGYTLSVEGTHLEIGPLLGPAQNLSGSITLEAKGFGIDSRNAQGRGALRLNGGVLTPFPILDEIDERLGRPGLVSNSFEPFELDFEVNRGQWVMYPFELRTPRVTLAIDGSVHFDGALSVDVNVEPDDGRPSYFRVSGTVDEPIVKEVGGRP